MLVAHLVLMLQHNARAEVFISRLYEKQGLGQHLGQRLEIWRNGEMAKWQLVTSD